MENYIVIFKTNSEYQQNKGSIPYPNVVYIEENNELLYLPTKPQSGYEPLRVWVDDFEDAELIAEIPNFIQDPDGLGSNQYDSMNETINIDGVDYCLWECSDSENCSSVPYLLTTTYDYDTLYSESLQQNTENTFNSYFSMMQDDNEVYNEGDTTQKLVKVVKL